jgi:NAD(P)H-dependent FMN reductase
MLKFPESLQKKPVCFTGLSTGDGGGLRSVGQLQAIFIYRKAYLFPETVLISLIGNHLTPEGRISNEKVLGELRGQAEGFIGFVKLLTGSE